MYEVWRSAPFQRTTEFMVNPVPATLMLESGLPARKLLGLTDVMTGVAVGGEMVRFVDGEVPPPGAGLVTVTARVPCVA